MPRTCAFALPVIALLVVTGADATPARSETQVQAELSDLETGRLLIRAGRLEHARAFLEQAEPASEEERIERLFLLGQIALRLGMPEDAVERFEAILALRPGLTRVRLELARAYYLTGFEAKAHSQFGLALGDELPSSVEAAVESFLRRIDTRKRWSVSFSASVLPETRRPERETVLIGGVPFGLDEEARASSGAGVLLSGGASFTPQLTGSVRGVFAGSAATKVYERSSWNETTASGELGVARLLDRGSVSGGVRMGRVWTGGDPKRMTLGPWARIGWRLSRSTRLDVALNADRRRHDTRDARDGWRLAAVPRLVHAFDGRTSIELEPMFEAVTAKQGHHGSRVVGIGATVSRAFNGEFFVSVSSSAQVRRHSGDDPLFGERRIDRTLRVAMRAHHRSFRFRGFAPYIGYSVERNRSTIAIHESRIQGLVAGVSRAF